MDIGENKYKDFFKFIFLKYYKEFDVKKWLNIGPIPIIVSALCVFCYIFYRQKKAQRVCILTSKFQLTMLIQHVICNLVYPPISIMEPD